jgi:hypothetical protein
MLWTSGDIHLLSPLFGEHNTVFSSDASGRLPQVWSLAQVLAVCFSAILTQASAPSGEYRPKTFPSDMVRTAGSQALSQPSLRPMPGEISPYVGKKSVLCPKNFGFSPVVNVYEDKNSLRANPDCRIMDWSVPMLSSWWSGTGMVIVVFDSFFCMIT